MNYNVVGGGLALALSTYAGSLAEAFLWGCGGIPYFVPGGALVGAVLSCSVFDAATGVAFGIGQILGVVLMVAGSTFFRRAPAQDLTLTADGLAISF